MSIINTSNNLQKLNQTLLQVKHFNSNIILIDNWKHYLAILNLLISVSFICNCFLLIYLLSNIIRHYLCCCIFRTNLSTKKYFISNYVTIAFVSHQALVDIIRILYCLFYINNLRYEYESSGDNYILFTNIVGGFYNKYCFQIASFYSILTMVTLINTLTIFICETCRFYDLKLNSSDTSNICCVIFGIMLIWLSSLIIISSIMLIGIASSAAPICNEFIIQDQISNQVDSALAKTTFTGSTTTATRTFVINCVWFAIVCLIICVAVFYSRSLYKELNSLDYKHHRISIYALYAPNKNPKATSTNFQRRHYFIVKQTSKRLVILFVLIIIFCVTWFPNFLFILLSTFLRNFYLTSSSFRAATLFSSIFWMLNPCFNSFVFLCLLIKEHKNNVRFNVDEASDSNEGKFNIIQAVTQLFSSLKKKTLKIKRERSLSFIEMQSEQLNSNSSDNTSTRNMFSKKRVDFDDLKNKVGNRLGDSNEESDLFI